MVRVVAAGEQHVGGLHVAVYQPVAVCGVQRRGHLRDHVHGAHRVEPVLAGQQGGEVRAVDEAHVDEQPAVDLAEVVDGHDVRLAQPRRDLRLAPEPGREPGIARELRGQQLQRDDPVAT